MDKGNLARLYKDQSKYDKAEPLLLEVISQQEKKLGADHPITLTTLDNLARAYFAAGNHPNRRASASQAVIASGQAEGSPIGSPLARLTDATTR